MRPIRKTGLAIALPFLVATGCGRTAGGAGMSLKAGTAATVDKARADFECRPATSDRRYFCTRDRTLLGQESTILGTVFRVDRVGDRCPEPFAKDEHREPIVPGLDKQALNLTNAVTSQIDFALVERDVTASVKALAFLASSLERDAVASVELVRTTRAVLEDARFNQAVTAFAERHPGACRLYVATGYAADAFTARVFTVANARAGGGVYGVNVGGTYFASDETVRRDYQWAMSIVRIDLGESSNKSGEPTLAIEPRVDVATELAADLFVSPP